MRKNIAFVLILASGLLFLASCYTEAPTFDGESTVTISETKISLTEEEAASPNIIEDKTSELFGIGNISDTRMTPNSAGNHCWGNHIYFRGTMTDNSGNYITLLVLFLFVYLERFYLSFFNIKTTLILSSGSIIYISF